MKKKKIIFYTLCLVFSFILTGCAQVVTLTSEEEDQIAAYCAKTVAKFNKLKAQGVINLRHDEEDTDDASLEQTDTPSFEDAVAHLKEKNAKKILLAPFLVGAGIHATRDMAGDEPTSWKNRLTAEGFSLRVDMRSLTEYDAIRNIYMQKIAKLTGEKLS